MAEEVWAGADGSTEGVVSLAKIRPVEIPPEEVAVVEAEVRRHPKAHNYRVDVKGDQIVVYERTGADPDGPAVDLQAGHRRVL